MGGLVGWNNGAGIIQDSYATGNVTAGSGGTRAGGLTAQNNGRILRSYATGAVSGGSQGVGGLVGFNSTGTPTIVDSYATGAVTATSFGGGLVGINSVGASIDNSYAAGAVSVASSTITTLFGGGLIGTNSGASHPVPCDRGRGRDVHLCRGHGHVGGRTDRQQRQHGYGHTVLRDRCGQRRLGRRDDNDGWIDRQERRRGHRHTVLCDRCGQRHLRCRVSDGGRTDRQPHQHRGGHPDLRDRHRERHFDLQHCGGWRLDRIGYRHRGRHVVLLGHRYVREGECRRQRRQHRHHRSHHQPDAESGKLCVNLRGLGFRHRLVGAERRLLPAALWRQLRAAGRSCQRVAGLW